MEAIINKKALKEYCVPFEKHKAIPSIGFKLLQSNPIDGLLAYKDSQSSILGIAHLDVSEAVKPDKSDNKYPFYDDGEFVYCPSLDDRLGVYIICEVLPKMGIITDILLTDNEEYVQSTAMDFIPTKDYNWIFSFDRRGTSTVLYQYEDSKFRDRVYPIMGDIDFGTYSDIRECDFLGVKGLNIGTGYYLEHTNQSFANLLHTSQMIDRFKIFYTLYKDIRLEHSKKRKVVYGTTKYHKVSNPYEDYDNYYDTYGWYEIDDNDGSYLECPICGEYRKQADMIDFIDGNEEFYKEDLNCQDWGYDCMCIKCYEYFMYVQNKG